MHVCFEFSQPTDPNISPYDKYLMTFSRSRGKYEIFEAQTCCNKLSYLNVI